MQSGGRAWLEGVAERLRREAEGGAAPRPEELSVRELLGHFNALRRGAWIVRNVRAGLDACGLAISDNFEGGWLDSTVSITLDQADGEKPNADPTPRLESLTAAHHPPVCVKPDDTLATATTLMRMWDYSQLPVVTVERLDAIREIRNDVMHFSPDPLGDAEMDQLESVVRFFRTLTPASKPARE